MTEVERDDASTPRSEAGPRWNGEAPDAALLEAMRAGDERAFTEFVRRWQPLLSDAARRQGVPAGERDDLVSDVLVAACAAIGEGRAVPRATAAYLVAALRNRVRNLQRAAQRRRRHEEAAEAVGALGARGAESGSGGGIAREGSSAPVAAASGGPDPLASPALRRLARALVAELSAEDRLLLVWAGHHVPHRTIGDWLQLSPGAVTKRLERLRTRLRPAAWAHLGRAAPDDAAALRRFFHRADTPPPTVPSAPPAAVPARGSGVPVRRPPAARGRTT